MKQFRFLDWQVYKDSRDLSIAVIKIVKKMSKEYRYDLGSQMIRSSLSVGLNIAEGSGKKTDKDLGRFIDISFGSLYETLANADILNKSNIIKKEEYELVYKKAEGIANQLGGLKKKLHPGIVSRK